MNYQIPVIEGLGKIMEIVREKRKNAIIGILTDIFPNWVIKTRNLISYFDGDPFFIYPYIDAKIPRVEVYIREYYKEKKLFITYVGKHGFRDRKIIKIKTDYPFDLIDKHELIEIANSFIAIYREYEQKREAVEIEREEEKIKKQEALAKLFEPIRSELLSNGIVFKDLTGIGGTIQPVKDGPVISIYGNCANFYIHLDESLYIPIKIKLIPELVGFLKRNYE